MIRLSRPQKRTVLARNGLLVWLLATIVAPGFALAQNGPTECSDPEAAWIFCTGFEEGDFDLWDDWDGNPPETNQLLADPGPQNAEGNHVARLQVPSERGGADLTKVLPDSYDVLYARWYAKWEPGFDFTTLQHGGGLHAGDRGLLGHSGDRPDGSDWFSSWIEPGPGTGRFSSYTYYRGMYMNCVDPVGSCWGDNLPCLQDEGEIFCTNPAHRETVTPPLMESGRWYCLEIMLDGGTPVVDGAEADGIFNYWIDGQEMGPWNDLWLRTTDQLQLTILWLSLWFHGDHGPQGILIDDVVVSTERIGPASNVPTGGQTWGTFKSLFR